MNLFQWLTLPPLGLLLLWELLSLWRVPGTRGVRLVRLAIWAAVTLAIAQPDLVQRMANSIGIGRGADVVLYLLVFAFLGTSFYFYARYVRLQRQMTQVVRHLALQEAHRGRVDSLGPGARREPPVE
jgi:hypothetical protein